MKRYRLTCVIAIPLLAAFFALLPALSSAEEPTDTGKKVEEQQKEIDALRESVKKLEQAAPGGELHGGLKHDGTQMDTHFGAYGDINFSTESREKAKKSFFIGDVDLHATGNYGDRLTSLIEMIVQVGDSGETVDVARVWIGYSFSDLLILRAGKQHTALGFWNKTYHHGRQLFPTIDRPFFLAFEYEGGIMPMHMTGIEFEGRWSTSFARFKYEFDAGNGPRYDQTTRRLDSNSASDNNNSKQIALRISGESANIPDLSMGVFATAYSIDTGPSVINESVYGADISYNYHDIDLLAEYFLLRNSVAASEAYYVQLSYPITEDLTPYARYETLNASSKDPYLASLDGGFGRRQTIAGIKYDIDAVRSSIKAQYRYDKTRDGKDYNVFEAQWSFGF